MFSLMFMFASSILISYADHKITTFTSGVNELVSIAANQLQRITQITQQSNGNTMYQLFQLESLTDTERQQLIDSDIVSMESSLLKDPKIVQLLEHLKHNQITVRQFFSDVAKYQSELIHDITNEYNWYVASINYAKTEGTNWAIVRIILYPLQILALLVLASEYYKLMKDISNRITNTKQQKGKTTSP